MVFGLVLMPLNTLDFLGPNTLHWNELFDALVKGASCLGGVNSVVPPNCWTPPDRVDGVLPCDTCHGAWLPVLSYMTFNCMFNVAMSPHHHRQRHCVTVFITITLR
jgi:hypothetical protein